MAKSNKVKMITDREGTELVMVRVGKTLKDLIEEKPSSRWDPEYWHPTYDKVFEQLCSADNEIVLLGQIMLKGIDGITYGQVGRRLYDKKGAVQYLQVTNIRRTGIDIYEQHARVKQGSHNDPPRSRLSELDVLLINGGVGSLGRSCILLNKDREYNISQDIDRIRLKKPEQGFYVTVFLNSYFGMKQIERFSKGVSGQTKIGFDHVRSIRIPLIPDSVQQNIRSEHMKMAAFHLRAMEAKANDDSVAYQNNINKAEQMLRDLISHTEAVIRGEQDDVI